jgi:excisionase family DNA binding protein
VLVVSAETNDNGGWPAELKAIIDSLIDLAVRVMETNRTQLPLNEVLTAEELSTRLKIPGSTIEELARKGKIPGAFRVGKHWRFDLDVLRTALPIQTPNR